MISSYRPYFFFLLALLVVPMHSLSQGLREQAWTEIDAYARLSSAIRLIGTVQLIQDQNADGDQDLFVGGFLDVGLQPILRERVDSIDWAAQPLEFLRLRVGAAYLAPLGSENAGYEYRGIADLTPRYRLWRNILVVFRNRTEWRFIDGDFAFRYRPRLWVEKTFFDVLGFPVTPHASYELFFDSLEDGFTRSQTQAGVSVALTRWLAPDIQVAYQHNWTNGAADILAVDLVVALYF